MDLVPVVQNSFVPGLRLKAQFLFRPSLADTTVYDDPNADLKLAVPIRAFRI